MKQTYHPYTGVLHTQTPASPPGNIARLCLLAISIEVCCVSLDWIVVLQPLLVLGAIVSSISTANVPVMSAMSMEGMEVEATIAINQ